MNGLMAHSRLCGVILDLALVEHHSEVSTPEQNAPRLCLATKRTRIDPLARQYYHSTQEISNNSCVPYVKNM
jgi:hypothetical protein